MKERLSTASALIITDGGGPSPRQRRELEGYFGRVVKDMRIGVVSDAASTHFILTALSFFIKNIGSFSMDQFSGACDFVGFDGAAQTRVLLAAAGVPRGRFRVLDVLLSRGQPVHTPAHPG